MTRLASGSSVPGLDTEDMQSQMAALWDAMRQISGDARVVPGSAATMDPLVAPFKLFVNPYIGSDKFVAGSFNSYESSGTDEEKIAQKLKRLSNQAMTCGYSPLRPFKTINRAVIEAWVTTSRNYYTFTDPRAQIDCVLICLTTGRQIIYNQPGNHPDAIPVSSWEDGFVPTKNHLIAFNPNEGGLLIPRAASFSGDDLRKCVLSPDWVPAVADEAADYSNRSAILRPTPLSLGGQFTFVDKLDWNQSHHLLDCIQFATQAQLDTACEKVYLACGEGANLAEALMVARPTEYNVVGQFQEPISSAWDTTASASAYIFNASIRSDYGLGGIFLDGDKVGGLKSMVTAQFTGVVLQKDLSCWEVYVGGAWVQPSDYEQFIDASPDDTRWKPARRTWHLSAVNDAFMQGVSEFNVGQAGCRTDNGGEITLTNSNSTFGNVGGLSKGYKRKAFQNDSNWATSAVKVPLTPADKVGNVKKIQLGIVSSYSTSLNRITLATPLAFDADNDATPSTLLDQGYTFAPGTYIWIENPSGVDWRANLVSGSWSSAAPAQINVSDTPVEASGSPAASAAALAGKRVYLRRIVDTRTTSERRCSIQISNTASARIPERNFALQTDPTRSGGAIARALNKTTELLLVSNAGSISGVQPRNAEITLRRGAPSIVYANNTFFVNGQIVKYANKHFQCLRTGYTSTAEPDPKQWGETLVHMQSEFNAEDSRLSEGLILTFDTDTDGSESSTTLGINWGTAFTNAGSIRDGYRASADYLGAHAFLVALGIGPADAHAALLPRSASARLRNPESSSDFPVAPSGGAATGRGNWAVEFRRPSQLRMYGHAWEWAGFGGYSKALPPSQQTMSVYNKFTYYFTNEAGGRVVPTGYNEDGFAVSSRGLEDVETGQALSVNNLDSPDIDQATEFNNITINNLVVNGVLDGSGITSLVNFAFAQKAGDEMNWLAINRTRQSTFRLSLNGGVTSSFVNMGASNTIDCSSGNYFKKSIAGNTTISITGVPSSDYYSFTLEIAYTSGSLTLPASLRYPFGLGPSFSAGKVYQIIADTSNGGTTWLANVIEYIP